MRRDISPVKAPGDIVNASDRELRAVSWLCGLLVSEMNGGQAADFLGKLLSRALGAEQKTRELVLGHLLQQVEMMSPEDQAALVIAVIADQLAAEPVGQMSDEAAARLLSRLAPKAVDTVTEYAQSLLSSPGHSEQQFGSVISNICLALKEEIATHDAARCASAVGARTDDRPTVALVIPEYLSADSFLQPDIGMLQAAARLRAAGYGIIYIDNRIEHLPLSRLEERISHANAVFVTTTPYDHIQNYFLDYRLRHSIKTINAIKRACSRAKIVVCGAHGTVRPDLMLRDTEADLILRGQYDAGVASLVDRLFAGGLDDQPNVCMREHETAPFHIDEWGRYCADKADDSSACPGTQRDDEHIMPAYDLVDFDRYYGDQYIANHARRHKRWATVLATRGCAHGCSFCYNFWGRTVNYRNPESVVREVEWLRDAHGISNIFFIDSHFTQSAKWVTEFCDLMRARNVDVRWSAQARCDALPREVLSSLAVARCEHLWLGVESFDSDVISSTGKYHDAGEALVTIENCRNAGIEPHLFIMIGLPGETRDSINKTIARMHAVKASYCDVMVATPRFGAEHYKLAKEQFPQLGNDFYGLRSVRGLVGNNLEPDDLSDAVSIFRDREFIYKQSPQLL